MRQLGSRTSPEAVSLAHEALAMVRRNFRIPDGAGILLTGSLADGLGNGYSDIDIEVLDPLADAVGIGRHYAALGHQRVEVFFPSRADLKGLSDRAKRWRRDGGHVPLGILKEYHNYCYGYPLQNRDVVEAMTADFNPDLLAECAVAETRRLAATEGGMWRAMSTLARPPEAVDALRRAATFAALGWAAERGETFLSCNGKWRLWQLKRAGLPDSLLERYLALALHAEANRLEEGEEQKSCSALFEAFGTDHRCFDADVRVAPVSGVQTTRHGGRTYISGPGEHGRGTFVLNAQADRIWAKLLAESEEGGSRVDGWARAERAIVGNLHLQGLLRASVGTFLTDFVEPQVPSVHDPGVALDALDASTDQAVTRVSVCHRALPKYDAQLRRSAGWIRRARKSAISATENAQWPVVERALDVAVGAASAAKLAALGITAPELVAPQVLERHPALSEMAVEARRLRRLRVAGVADARAALHALDAWLARLHLVEG